MDVDPKTASPVIRLLMENKSQPALEQEPVQGRRATPSGEDSQAGDSDALTRLLRKRLERYVSIMPVVLVGDDPDAVHDVRVWSRRLQQSLVALFPKPRSGKVRKLRRTLRRVRRALGQWRNCDVVLKLASKQQQRTRSREKKQAWGLVRDYLLQRRGDQVARARKKLRRQDLADLVGRIEKLMVQSGGQQETEALMARLCAGIEGAWTKWQSSLVQAVEARQRSDIHALRIASKTLRYRIELLHDLGDANTQPLLEWLKELQEALGIWHDRQVLYQAMAEAMARPEFLLRRPDVARKLLIEMEKDYLRQETAINEIFRLAAEHGGRKQMETWIAKTPHETAPPDRT